MFDLTRQEKIILVFLILAFAAGLGISAYKKGQKSPALSVQPYQLTRQAAADKFIQQHRQVNINSLNIDELIQLPGIGEKLAERIVEYHQIHGPFTSKEELLQVEGIGEKKLEKFKDWIVFE